MNDVPLHPGQPDPHSEPEPASGPGLGGVDQSALPPTERRFGEGLPSDGPNGQGSTRLYVARPTDPGAAPGVVAGVPALGAEETEGLLRGAPELAARPGAGAWVGSDEHDDGG